MPTGGRVPLLDRLDGGLNKAFKQGADIVDEKILLNGHCCLTSNRTQQLGNFFAERDGFIGGRIESIDELEDTDNLTMMVAHG